MYLMFRRGLWSVFCRFPVVLMMRFKRTSQRTQNEESSQRKRLKNIASDDYFSETLKECGLQLRDSPDKCVASDETIVIIRNLKKTLQKHADYPSNVSEFYSNFVKRCQDLTDFEHYLFPNIVRQTSESSETSVVSVSLVKILLSVQILQSKLIDFIFEKAIDLAGESKCGPWIQMILKCLSTLDNIVDTNKIAVQLIDLLDVASEHMVRLEIITAIPDIIGDQAHENIAAEMSRILSDDHNLTPAILDCLSYLCLSDEQYKELQKKTLNILTTISKCNYFPNFVKFLLIPHRTSETAYLEVVLGLRNALYWSTAIDTPEDIVSSQVLTSIAIRNSIVSSKVIANAWLKAISMCTVNTDHKPIDFVIMVILYSTSEEKQKQLENLIRKQVKSSILDEELIDQAFEKFRPIIKDNLKHLISLTNALLEATTEPVIQYFASHLYTLMFSKLEEFCQTIVAELLQLGLDSKHCVLNILSILNNVATKDMSKLKPQSVQMLKLLDRTDDMTLPEIRAVMNLLCGLAYSCENSDIRDDIHMIIRKELGSSNPNVKLQGIIASVHAVKYLMASKDGEDESIDNENSDSSVHLQGDLQEAVQILEAISRCTRQHPNMKAFFYDELCTIIKSARYINKHFLHWMTYAVTNDVEQNFIINRLEQNVIDDIKLDVQYCLNSDSEVDEVLAINVAGMTLQAKEDVNIQILSPLFQLVQTLHLQLHNGDLSNIDALLGCPVVMPIFDTDFIEDMSTINISHILDCQIHCTNWFREIVNAFASQNDLILKQKIFNRISHLQKLENLISTILLKINFTYKPPEKISSYKNNNKDALAKNNTKKQNTKQKNQKKTHNEETALHETVKSQSSSAHNDKIVIKNKAGLVHNITLRPFRLSILNLLNKDITEDKDERGLSIENLPYLLKGVNCCLESVLLSRIKKKTFLSKQDTADIYDSNKAEEYAKSLNEIVPKIIDHITFITSYLDKSLEGIENKDEELLMNDKYSDHVQSLEYIFNMFTVYIKWTGFKTQHKALLETTLRSIVSSEAEKPTPLQNLFISVAKYFQKHEKYCVHLTTAVSLLDVVSALQEHTSRAAVIKILRKMAHNFLSREWRTASGGAEKGLFFNQSIDSFVQLYVKNIEISEIKSTILLLVNDVQNMKSRNSTLSTFASISKANLHILYRSLGAALHESAKTLLNKGLTNLEHLDLWKEVAFMLKCMSELAKSLKVRNILIAFFKKSLPIIRLFVQQGIPIIELEFKKRTKNIQDILGTLQQSTRFLQTLGRHFRAKKDKALLGKVPYMKQLLETLLYKVKAVLAANDCSGAFWMGILKNKTIDGEVIATQQSEESDEAEDDDDQLPDDDTDDENEILEPDSRSISDCV